VPIGAYQIAQLNIARAVAPLDHPRMAGFMARLDNVNVLAERSRGFVWRLQGESGNNTDLKVDADPRVILNLTVWESPEALFEFTYRSAHKGVFARRFDWFERWTGPSVVLWWLLAGATPTVDEALRRLRLLAEHGPTPEAFTFKHRFPMPVRSDAGATSTEEVGA
jgi:hypothetical protein